MTLHHFTRAVGEASVILQVTIEDSGTPGTGKTGLAFNTASLTAYYQIDGAAAPVAIPLVTCTIGTWTSGGFKEIDATKQPGKYQLHVPNTAFGSGRMVSIVLTGAAGMFTCYADVDLGTALTVAAQDALLNRTMTEAYSGPTSTLTLAKALHMIWSLLANRSISSTTLTALQLDHSTPAMTFTLNSATVPTSQTRAT